MEECFESSIACRQIGLIVLQEKLKDGEEKGSESCLTNGDIETDPRKVGTILPIPFCTNHFPHIRQGRFKL